MRRLLTKIDVIRTVEFGLAFACALAALGLGGDPVLIVVALSLGWVFAAIGIGTATIRRKALWCLLVLLFFVGEGTLLYWHNYTHAPPLSPEVKAPPQPPPHIGWLQPANDPTPPNGCDGVPEQYLPKDRVLIVLGNSAFAVVPKERPSSPILTLGNCPLLSETLGPNGLAISADLYDQQGQHVGTIRDNGYKVSGDSNYITQMSGDLSTLWVHSKDGTELLYVRYLNPKAIRVRGEFACPKPRLRTIEITNEKLTLPNNNIINCFSRGGITIQ
jgi:hypothetical protein